MVRLLAILVVLALAAFGLSWLAENPGEAAVTWRGVEYEAPLMLVLGVLIALYLLLALVWMAFSFIFRVPSLISFATRSRRREKGFEALSRGMIAIGSGDARAADRHAAEARKFLGEEPLALLLRAQSAQLAGDRAGAVGAFAEMLDDPRTHALGLRGLHVEARRSGDAEAALEYAARANRYAALPWAAQAVLDDRAARGDWEGALACVETNAAARLLDRPTANRWRAVLKTAIAQRRAEREIKCALAMVRDACSLAPGLVPAAALYGKLTASTGDYRAASKIIEAAYRAIPHPDLAAAYLRLRPGDSVADRLIRARALARVSPFDPESYLTIARAALEAQDLKAARSALAPLVRGDAGVGRPTARVCLAMAEIEEAAGNEGAVREWLSRAARAPRDRAWVAESVITDNWSPVTPSGVLDGFVWKTPDERTTAPQMPPVASDPAPAVVVAAAAPAAIAAPAPAVMAPREPRVPARVGAKPILLSASAPDDPGPHALSAREPHFGMYASE